MISKFIITAILKSATQQSKDKIINEFLNHLSLTCDYNDTRVNHVLEMLCSENIIDIANINIYYIEQHLGVLIYNHEDFNFKNIKIAAVDNIDCTVKVTYDYIKKVDENKDNASYTSTYTWINFIDNPDILSK